MVFLVTLFESDTDVQVVAVDYDEMSQQKSTIKKRKTLQYESSNSSFDMYLDN